MVLLRLVSESIEPQLPHSCNRRLACARVAGRVYLHSQTRRSHEIQIKQTFEKYLQRLPSELKEASRSLNRIVGIRKGSPDDWTTRFDHLTLSLPMLHRELYRSDAKEDNVALSHLLFLICAFVDDRLLDRQLSISRPQHLFLQRIWFDASAILRDTIRDAWGRNEVIRRLSEYAHAQLTRYGSLSQDSAVWHRGVKTLSSGRAAFGVLATVGLLSKYRVPDNQRRIALNAFDCLVTGLQWADDMEDWRDDLATGDENLLFEWARMNSGITPLGQPVSQVALSLVQTEACAHAGRFATHWLVAARNRYRRLGCVEISECVETILPVVQDRVAIHQERIEGEALTAAMRTFQNALRKRESRE